MHAKRKVFDLIRMRFVSFFIDPLGLSTGISQEKFDFYRAAELKNGRAAMLAVAGYVNAEIWRFPGEVAPGLKFADVPNGIKALDAIPALGWMQMFFLIGAVDYYGFFQYPNNVPDLAPEEMERRQLSELTYVRACFGFAGWSAASAQLSHVLFSFSVR